MVQPVFQPFDDLLLQQFGLLYSGARSQSNGLSIEFDSSSSVVPQSGSTPLKLQEPFIMHPCTSTSSSATSTSCLSNSAISRQALSDPSSSCGDTLEIASPTSAALNSEGSGLFAGAAMFTTTTPSIASPISPCVAETSLGHDVPTPKSQTKPTTPVRARPKSKTTTGSLEKKASGIQVSPISGGPVRGPKNRATSKRSHETVHFSQASHGFVSLCKIVPPSQLAPQPALFLSSPPPSPAHTERLANLHTNLRKASHIASLIIVQPESLISEGFLFSASYAVTATVVHHTCNTTPSTSPSRLRVASHDSGIDVSSPPPTPSPEKLASNPQKQDCACRPFAIPVPTQLHPEDVVLAMDQQTALASVANRWALTRSAFGLLFSVPAPVVDATILSSSNAERSLLYLFSLVPETNQWMVLLV
ncbi:hypothetical protein BJ742DRAFT_743293 [Cladochytrium replicatum]|nr:hypothetical protein BJ742DRAFT_743293 [Cladochytrium replicatum]